MLFIHYFSTVIQTSKVSTDKYGMVYNTLTGVAYNTLVPRGAITREHVQAIGTDAILARVAVTFIGFYQGQNEKVNLIIFQI